MLMHVCAPLQETRRGLQCAVDLPGISYSCCSPSIHTILEALNPVGYEGVQELSWSLLQAEAWNAGGQSPLHPLHDDIPSLFPKQCYKERRLPICLHANQAEISTLDWTSQLQFTLHATAKMSSYPHPHERIAWCCCETCVE